MPKPVDPNEIGSGYSDDDLDAFDEKELDQYTKSKAYSPEEEPSEDEAPAAEDTAADVGDKADKEPKDDAPKDEEPAAKGEAAKGESSAEETPKPDYWMPKSRYDFAQAKRREAEAELERVRQENAELQAQVNQTRQAAPTGPKTDAAAELEATLADLDRQIEAARLDGDVDKAAQLAGEIRKVERQIFATPGVDVDQIREQAAHEARQSLLFDQAASAVEQKYPVLNPEHASYNKDLMDEVSDLFGALVKKYDSVTALNRAVDYVMGPQSVPPAGTAPTKRTTDVKKNVAAAKSMPPDLEGFDSDRGGPTRKLDPAAMTIEEFEALSDADEERLLA
jgi:hypothetical protein